jgi:hypothetical protein
MPVILNTMEPISESVIFAKKQVAAAVTFDYEVIEELIFQFNDEYFGRYEANLECVGESMCLHVYERETQRVIVYHVNNCPDLYRAIEAKYITRMIGSDFANNELDDKWEAFLSTIDSCKIMDTTIELS